MLSESTRQSILLELGRYPVRRSAYLPALKLAQAETGWLSRETVAETAQLLGADPNTLYDLATFYSLLHTEPAGRYVMRVCNGLSCYVRGSDPLLEHVCERLGVAPYGTTDDRKWTAMPFECLAACDGAPALMVNDDLYTRMNAEQVDALIDDLTRAADTQPTARAVPE